MTSIVSVRDRQRSLLATHTFLTDKFAEAAAGAYDFTELSSELLIQWFDGDEEEDPLSADKSHYFHQKGYKFLKDPSPLDERRTGPILIQAQKDAQQAFKDACQAYWKMEKSFERIYDAYEPLIREKRALKEKGLKKKKKKQRG